MSKANAVLILKKSGLIESAKDARFVCYDGDYIFSIKDGHIVAVDPVLGCIVRINGAKV